MNNLRWIQSLAAGPNNVLATGYNILKVFLTTGSGILDATVAEHTLGLLNAARRFYEMRDCYLHTIKCCMRHLSPMFYFY